jgi:MFS family permease
MDHSESNKKDGLLCDDDKGSNKTDVDNDVEKQETTKEGETSTHSPEAVKREWIRTNPRSPRNWPLWRKWSIIAGLNFYTIIVFICCNAFVTDEAEDQFGIGTEVSVLGQSMFILGIAIGPMFLAPLSEVHGRQPVYTTGIFLFSLLQIPAALSPTYAGLIISRFLAGCFAGIPLSNVGASAADLFRPSQTAWPIMTFSLCSQVIGADLGPVIGSAIYVRTNSLNWVYWTTLIAGMFTFAWSLTFGETLHDKVYEKHTGIKEEKSATAYIGRELGRAAIFLCTEPIVMALALTTTFLFGLIFIYLEGYTFVFEKHYDLSTVPEGAMFLVGIGGGFVALITQPIQNYLYRRSAKSTSNGKPRPEARLYTACFGVWVMLISIFWFAFTSPLNPKTTSYQVPMWSGFLFGYAEVAIYTGLWQYGTDSYGGNAGSALAAINLPANGAAAGLAHAAVPFFKNVGDKWTLGILGFISVLYLAVPPLLIWKGKWLRERSKFALSRETEAVDD